MSDPIVTEDRRAALDSVLPDGRYRERTLREITRFLPKPGASWCLGYQHGDNPPVTLTPGIPASLSTG